MSRLIRPNYGKANRKRAMRIALERKLAKDPMPESDTPIKKPKRIYSKVRTTSPGRRRNPKAGI